MFPNVPTCMEMVIDLHWNLGQFLGDFDQPADGVNFLASEIRSNHHPQAISEYRVYDDHSISQYPIHIYIYISEEHIRYWCVWK